MSIPFKLSPLGLENGGLPAGYTRLEYLENTGTAYLRTSSVEWGFDAKLELDLMRGEGNPLWACPFDAGGNFNGKYYRWGIYGNLRWDYGNDVETNYGSMIGRGSLTDGIRATLLKDREKNYINGSLVCENPAATSEWNYKCAPAFFKAAGYPFLGKIYSAKGWNSDVLVFNLIPTLDPTGTPCMFDLVTRKPFYNQGTGDFTYA